MAVRSRVWLWEWVPEAGQGRSLQMKKEDSKILGCGMAARQCCTGNRIVARVGREKTTDPDFNEGGK